MATNGYVIPMLRFRQVERRWLGECLELGTATDGRTLAGVHNELLELVELHLDTLDAVGEHERFFREHDIRFYVDGEVPSEVQKPVPVDTECYVHAHRLAVPVSA